MRPTLAVAVLLALASGPAHALDRATVDRPDDSPVAQQIHVIYAVPSDGPDHALDTSNALEATVGSWNNWFFGQTGTTGIRVDTFNNELDVTFVRLPSTDAELASENLFIRDRIERELADAGFAVPGKIYAVYYDGTAKEVCGGGAWPPALPGRVAATYLHGVFTDGSPPCDSIPLAASSSSPPGYPEFAMLHEVIHTMGFVATCAPHHTRNGHASDSPSDLMYAGDQPWSPSVLDVGRDDYYGHGRSDCLDLAKSFYLESNVPPAGSTGGGGGTTTTGGTTTGGTTTGGGDGSGSQQQPTTTGAKCVVPTIKGLTLKRARAALNKAGCRLGTVRGRKRHRGTARVRKQSRKPGRSLPVGTKVGVRVRYPPPR